MTSYLDKSPLAFLTAIILLLKIPVDFHVDILLIVVVLNELDLHSYAK